MDGDWMISTMGFGESVNHVVRFDLRPPSSMCLQQEPVTREQGRRPVW